MAITPKSQLRLAAITGSLMEISSEANRIASTPAAPEKIKADDLFEVLTQVGAAIKRIHGSGSFTEGAAGVFKHDTAVFSGSVSLKDSTGFRAVSLLSNGKISGSSDLQIGGNITGSHAVLSGNLAVEGGKITSSQSTVFVFDDGVSTLNLGSAATSINIGAAAGDVSVAGDLRINGNDIKDSAGNVRFTMFDGTPVYTTENGSILNDGDSLSYSGDQGTIALPSNWISVSIILSSSPHQRTFAIPAIFSDSSTPIRATVSWSNATYEGGQSIVVSPYSTGTISIAGLGGGLFSGGSITVTAYSAAIDPTVEISADLRVKGNDIRDSRNDVIVSFSGDGQKLTTLSGDVKISGNNVRASDGGITLKMSGRDVLASGSLAVSGSSISLVGASNSNASISLKTGGNLKIDGGALSNGQPVVSLNMSGTTMGFSDGYMLGNWDKQFLSLADSTSDWQGFKNAFGEVSLLSALKAAAGGFGDGVHLYKVTSPSAAPATVQGTSLVRPQGTNFSTSWLATDASARNENVRFYLNGQMLVSKSFDSSNYDYDVFPDGRSVTFNFDLQQDDTITVVVPMAVASTDSYVATIGYDLCGTVSGKPASSEVLFKLVMPRTAMFNSGYAYADVAAVSAVSLKIQRGVASGGVVTYTEIGQINYAAGSSTGTVVWNGGYATLNRTEIIRIVAPSAVDATFSSPVFTLIGLEA